MIKLINSKVLQYLVIIVFIRFLFGFSLFILAGYLAGLLIFNLSSRINSKSTINQNIFLVIFGIAVVLLFNNNPLMTASFLIGANTANYFLRLGSTNSMHNTAVNLLNIICLSGITLVSGIQKFRGFNNLDPFNIEISIPLFILTILAGYFLLKAISGFLSLRKINPVHSAVVTTAVLGLSSYFISYSFFKEIGTETIAVPLIGGLLAVLLNVIIKGKNIAKVILEIFFLLIVPYQMAGLTGILLSMLSYALLSESFSSAIWEKISIEKISYLALAPILFLFASSEIRENEGLITRFNLASGYQTGWLFVSLAIYIYFPKMLDTLKNFFKSNEIVQFFPLTALLICLAVLIFIFRTGRDEAVSSLIIAGGVYLFINSLSGEKGEGESRSVISAVANFAGSIALFALAKI